MTTIIISLVLLVVENTLASLLAVLIDNFDAISQGRMPDHLSCEAQTLGVCMFFTSLALVIGLGWWFFRVEPRKRQHAVAGKGLFSFFTFQPLKRDIPVRPVGWDIVFMSVCAMLLFTLGMDSVLAPLELNDKGTTEMFECMVANPICVLMLCIVGPIAEELVFRMGVFRPLYRLGLPLWAAAVVSALLFGVIHGNLLQGIDAFVMGVILALLFWRSGDLRLCAAAHIANNTLAVSLYAFGPDDSSLPMVLGIVLLCAGIALFYRILHHTA